MLPVNGPALSLRIGTTKVFIRSPKTLFMIEALFQKRRQEIATKLQAHARGFMKRKQFLAMRAAGMIIMPSSSFIDCVFIPL